MRRAWSVLVSIVLVGCDGDRVAPGPSASASTPVAPTVSATPPPAAPAALPDDLPIDTLATALHCASGDKAGACGVLTAMRSCTPWDPVTPSGDARWMGRGFVVEDGKQSEEPIVMRARRVPTNEVGPGQLGVKIAIADVPKGSPGLDDADRALRAFERQDLPQRTNRMIAYIKDRTEWSESFAMRTAGGQVYVIEGAGGYGCQGPKQHVLVVQRAAKRGAASAADGKYVEMFPVTW